MSTLASAPRLLAHPNSRLGCAPQQVAKHHRVQQRQSRLARRTQTIVSALESKTVTKRAGSPGTSTAVAERTDSHAAASTSGRPDDTASTSAGLQTQAGVGQASWTGYAQLLVVPLLWGTYNPCIRYLYTEDNPLDPASLTAIRTTLSAVALLVAAALEQLIRLYKEQKSAAAASSLTSAESEAEEGGMQQRAVPEPIVSSKRLGPLLTLTFSNVWVAGLELGILNFLGTALQVQGLQTTSATRAGFLVQLTSVLTPLVSYLGGFDIPPRVWTAVVMGISGSCLVTWDSMQASMADGSSASLSFSGGELYLALACLFFSLCTVRMGLYAPRQPIVSLAAGKKIGLSVASIGWLAWNNLSQGTVTNAATLFAFPDLTARTALSNAVIVYSALGPGALASFLQASGQSTVPATQAQVIFSLTPLWSALFAYLTLGGETMGPTAWLGGAVIVAAGVVAATAQTPQQQAPAEPAAAGSGQAAIATGDNKEDVHVTKKRL